MKWWEISWFCYVFMAPSSVFLTFSWEISHNIMILRFCNIVEGQAKRILLRSLCILKNDFNVYLTTEKQFLIFDYQYYSTAEHKKSINPIDNCKVTDASDGNRQLKISHKKWQNIWKKARKKIFGQSRIRTRILLHCTRTACKMCAHSHH